MGKIRVNVIGDDAVENKQKEAAKKRQDSKKENKNIESVDETKEVKVEVKKIKKKVQKKSEGSIKIRSNRYTGNRKFIEKGKLYSINEALNLLNQLQKTNFDETVELHLNTLDRSVSGNIVLPHGSGKKTRVSIISPATNPKEADALLKKIESGKLDFDVLIATPDAMPKLAKVAKILGPKGLMPNPKNGTVSQKPEELAKKYEGGQISYKTESKFPIIHISVGKVSFGKEKLSENIHAFISSIDRSKLKNAYLKSSMSPSIKLSI